MRFGPLISHSQWLSGGACGGERAADPLHCPGIDPELFGTVAGDRFPIADIRAWWQSMSG